MKGHGARCAICTERLVCKRMVGKLDKKRQSCSFAHRFWSRIPNDSVASLTVEFGGCGLKGYWACGFAHIWTKLDMPHVKYEGASMGACIAVFVLCRITTYEWARSYYDLHFMTIHRGMCLSDAMRIVLLQILPEDAHTRCSGRLGIWVTRVTTLSCECIRTFHSKSVLISWLCASCHSVLTARTFTSGAFMDGMVFRYGEHAVLQPTLFISIHDIPTNVHPFVASKSIVRLVEQGAADARELLANPSVNPRIFRWMSVATTSSLHSVRFRTDALLYWIEWASRSARDDSEEN